MISWIGSSVPHGKKFLFLDRDGVINADRPDYIRSWKDFRFFPDTLEALRWLREKEIDVILVSNQSALHRGYMSWEDFWDIHYRMVREIRRTGGDLLAAFYCPHRPDEGCLCRKPSPCMILNAARIYSVPLKNTFMIGDRDTDLIAASEAGSRGVLLNRFPERSVLPSDLSPEGSPRCYVSFREAVEALFGFTLP